GIKSGCVLVGLVLTPWLPRAILRRATGTARGDNTSLVLSAVGAFMKVLVWVAGLAMTLSILGFDVTAIIAGLGIGGLAIGLAAQPMIADVIGAVIIFAERRFRIGDVVKLGNDEPAREVGLTWRSTELQDDDGHGVTGPNRHVND